jgi:hypothetical protein
MSRKTILFFVVLCTKLLMAEDPRYRVEARGSLRERSYRIYVGEEFCQALWDCELNADVFKAGQINKGNFPEGFAPKGRMNAIYRSVRDDYLTIFGKLPTQVRSSYVDVNGEAFMNAYEWALGKGFSNDAAGRIGAAATPSGKAVIDELRVLPESATPFGPEDLETSGRGAAEVIFRAPGENSSWAVTNLPDGYFPRNSRSTVNNPMRRTKVSSSFRSLRAGKGTIRYARNVAANVIGSELLVELIVRKAAQNDPTGQRLLNYYDGLQMSPAQAFNRGQVDYQQSLVAEQNEYINTVDAILNSGGQLPPAALRLSKDYRESQQNVNWEKAALRELRRCE